MASAYATFPQSGSSCDEVIHEILGQCAPFHVKEVSDRQAVCCGAGCTACTQPKTAAAYSSCPSGSCAGACTGERIPCENVVVLRGPRATFVPATPVAVSRVAVEGDQLFIHTAKVAGTGELRAISSHSAERPLQISVRGKQVLIRTANMNATCDQITELPTGPGHVLLEGNVKMTYHAPQSPTRIEANRIIVDLRNNEFKVMAANGAVRRPTQNLGFWYAPSPMPMMFPPAPPLPPAIGFPMPMPHPMPMSTPVSRPVSPAVYFPPMPSSPSR
jgi:hypothetical protein